MHELERSSILQLLWKKSQISRELNGACIHVSHKSESMEVEAGGAPLVRVLSESAELFARCFF